MILYAIIGVGGFLFLISVADLQDAINPMVIKVLAGGMSLFFIVVSGAYLKRLLDKDTGVTISKEGIIDRTSSISTGEVEWKNITGIRKDNRSKRYILVDIHKPEAIINSAKNGAIKRLMEQNMRLYGTPFLLDPVVLNCEVEDLESTLNSFYSKYGRKK